MRVKTLALTASLALALALPGCGSGASKGPGREALLAQLRQEGEALKKENEGQDTSLGVRATWDIAGVDLAEPAKKDDPWKGTIRFKIHSETRDGSKVQVDEFEKSFHYVYSTTLNKWVFEYQPS
jgi:hypothetical protein